MARTDSEQLVVELEARVRDFEKNFQKANRTANDNFKKIENRTSTAGKRMEKSMGEATKGIETKMIALSKSIKGGVAAAIVAASGAAIASARNVAREVANIGSEAKRAGVSVKAFQELRFVAEQNRIDVDAMVDGLKELNLRADEFVVTGKGPAAEAFQRLGFGAYELSRKLKDPSALLVDIIRKMQRLNKAAQIRIADELFGGTAGERFVELLDKGADGIERSIKEANELGIVLDEDVIKRADEIDRQFNLISQTIGTKMKGAIVSATIALADFMDTLNPPEQQRGNTIQNRLGIIYEQRERLKEALRAAKEQAENSLFGGGGGAEVQLLEKQIESLNDEAAKLMDIMDRRQGYRGIEGAGEAAEQATAKVRTLTESLVALKRQSETESMAMLKRYDARRANDAAKGGMLDLIGYAEGTDRGRGYNETLGYGAFTGGDRNLVAMTLREILALQKQMLAHPDNTFNSSALGRYQITSRTLRGLMGEMNLSGDEYFTADLQDRLAEQLLRRRGNSITGLRNEWEGLRGVSSSAIGRAMGISQQSMDPVDENVTQRIEEERAKREELAQAYQQIIEGSEGFTQQQRDELAALGMTEEAAAAYRYEQQLLNEAQRAGIDLTDEQRARIHELAGEMAAAEMQAGQFREAQANAAAMSDEWNNFASGALKGFISDLRDGASAGEAFANVLDQIAMKLLDVALNAIFSGGGGGGGIFGGIFSALFGGARAEGGPVEKNKVYRVGEKGEEWFVPKQSGTIIPNHDLPMMQNGASMIQTPQISRPNLQAPGQSGDQSVHVTVGIASDGNGNIKPFVESIARQQAGMAAAQLGKRVPAMVDARQAERQNRGTRA